MRPVTRFLIRDVIATTFATLARKAVWFAEWASVGWLLAVLWRAFITSPGTPPAWSDLLVWLAFLGAGSVASGLLWQLAAWADPWGPLYREPDEPDTDEPNDAGEHVADVVLLHRRADAPPRW